MLDGGASINLLLHSIYKQLVIGNIQPTNMVVQMEDNNTKSPLGILENVLIQVDKAVIPVDFVVMEAPTGGQSSRKEHTMLQGRQFMATTNATPDYGQGKVTMDIMGEKHEVQVFPALDMKALFAQECNFLDVCEELEIVDKCGKENLLPTTFSD